jgi:hypothetical protein
VKEIAMTDAYDDAFDDEPDDEPEATVPRHKALEQLDAWKKEAEEAVMKRSSGRITGGMSALDTLVGEALIQLHEDDIEELIKELEDERSMLQARIDSDVAQGNSPAQADLDELESLDDAIAELEDALDA